VNLESSARTKSAPRQCSSRSAIPRRSTTRATADPQSRGDQLPRHKSRGKDLNLRPSGYETSFSIVSEVLARLTLCHMGKCSLHVTAAFVGFSWDPTDLRAIFGSSFWRIQAGFRGARLPPSCRARPWSDSRSRFGAKVPQLIRFLSLRRTGMAAASDMPDLRVRHRGEPSAKNRPPAPQARRGRADRIPPRVRVSRRSQGS
jgi:hypothetical protein